MRVAVGETDNKLSIVRSVGEMEAIHGPEILPNAKRISRTRALKKFPPVRRPTFPWCANHMVGIGDLAGRQQNLASFGSHIHL
jgi:hypothetical protein